MLFRSDVYLSGPKSNSWVFDTGSVANICNTIQELRNPRQLSKNEVTMRVGNGASVVVIAVGTMPLHLPSGLILELSNCYYVPALCKNIAVIQHPTACCSAQVVDIILTEGLIRKYHIPQSGTTETLRVRNFTCS